jgi:hypothetical protein
MIRTREIYVNGQLAETETYDDGVSSADYVSAYRYKRENGGITINGVTVQTDPTSRANILGAKELGTSIKWKTPNGFVDLNALQVAALAQAVGLHIQKCFSAEAALTGQTFNTIAEVEAAFEAAYGEQ